MVALAVFIRVGVANKTIVSSCLWRQLPFQLGAAKLGLFEFCEDKMDEGTMPINAITDTTKLWTAKVQVVSKLAVRTAIYSPTQYQKMILVDELGDTVEAIIFRKDVDLYKNNLEESKTYKISNAQVTRVQEIYKNDLISSLYQWTISSHTSVMPVDKDVITSKAFKPNFIASDNFTKYFDSKKMISTICVIIERKGPRKITAQGQQQTIYEYVAIDKQLIPFVVTFWNDVVSDGVYSILNAIHRRPIVALLNFTVKGFYGLSLSSTSSSIVLDKMDHQSFVDMRSWQQQQKIIIDEIVEADGFFEEKIEMSPGVSKTINTVSDVLKAEKLGRFNIRAKGYLQNYSQNFIYMCCEKCNCGINVECNALFKCNTCEVQRVAKPRFRFRLNVFDDSGTLEVTAFGKDGELIIGMSAQHFNDQTVKDGVPPVESLNQKLDNLVMYMKIRSSHFTGRNGQESIVYTLLALECSPNPTALHLLTPNQKKDLNLGLTATPNLDDSCGAAKRKLDFGSSLVLDSGKPKDSCSPDDISVRRRLVKKGKTKIGEDNILNEQDVIYPCEEAIIHPTGQPENVSSHDEFPLSELIRSNKCHLLSRKLVASQTNPSGVTDMPVMVKTEKAGRTPNKLTKKRSMQCVVIDNDSEDDMDLHTKVNQEETQIKDVTTKIPTMKKSTRGRILRPKKFD